MAKQKSKGINVVGRVGREKSITVASGSLQTRAPGAGPGNRQSVARSPLLGFGGSEQGERGGPGTQQAGWSSRQQAQRMRARAEEERQGMAGQGSMQQSQAGGAGETTAGAGASMQRGGGQGQDAVPAPNANRPEANRSRASTKGAPKKGK